MALPALIPGALKALGIASTALSLPSIVETGVDLLDRTLPSMGQRRVQQILNQAGKSSMRGAIDGFLGEKAVQGESAFLDFLENSPRRTSFGASKGQAQIVEKAFLDSLMSSNQDLLRSVASRYAPPDQSHLLSRILSS